MANYPPHQVQADLKELMHSKRQEWFRVCVLFDMYLQIMKDRPRNPGMKEGKFNKMLSDQSMMPCSWIERRLDDTDHVMYRIRNGSCYLGDDCSFSPLYAKAKKILAYPKNHNWFK